MVGGRVAADHDRAGTLPVDVVFPVDRQVKVDDE